MITEDKVIEIFYMADEYSKEFSKVRQKYSLDEGQNDGKRRRNKPNRMSDAEIMVILILFHTGDTVPKSVSEIGQYKSLQIF